MGDKITLRPIWDAILGIYAEFAKLCNRHGLTYCADCGTALGAVRHKGFIPWDDDFDIQMPRPDYERFVKIAKVELPEGLSWLDRFNCATYEHAFGKVIITNRQIVERVAKESGLPLNQGIFIDVFPLDGYPDSKLSRGWRKIQGRMWEVWPIIAKIGTKMGMFGDGGMLRLWAHRKLSDLNEARAKRQQFGKTELCVSIGVSRWFDDKPYPFKYFGKPKYVPFDYTSIPVQENVEGYLTELFADYMKVPPLDKRHPAHNGGTPKPWRLGPI